MQENLSDFFLPNVINNALDHVLIYMEYLFVTHQHVKICLFVGITSLLISSHRFLLS